ncbi:MAG TPA: nuclear transport factor 2 family protein [Terriglobales bacterium]
MRTLWPLFLFLPLLFVAENGNVTSSPQAAPAQAQPQASPQQGEAQEEFRAEVEEGIKHMLVSQIEAWNHGNLEGFMQGYWHSPDLTFYSGADITKGWEPTLQRYRQRYQSQGKEMGQLDFQNLEIDVLGRRGAVVTGKWQLTLSDGTKPHGLFTLVVKKMPGGWKIVHDHTSAAQ